MQDYRKLKVWERAHQLTLVIYKVTKAFPKEEQYGLTGQIRRACASVPANIAEGCGRNGTAELLRFLHIAMGSASELDYHLFLARDLQCLTDAAHKKLEAEVTEVRRMLNSLIQKLRTNN